MAVKTKKVQVYVIACILSNRLIHKSVLSGIPTHTCCFMQVLCIDMKLKSGLTQL